MVVKNIFSKVIITDLCKIMVKKLLTFFSSALILNVFSFIVFDVFSSMKSQAFFNYLNDFLLSFCLEIFLSSASATDEFRFLISPDV